MFTGISGSKIVCIASMIFGFSSSVRATSGTSVPTSSVDDAGWGAGCGISGRGFMTPVLPKLPDTRIAKARKYQICRSSELSDFGNSFRRHYLFPVERSLERMPREARALDADRELAYAGQRRQLTEILNRPIGRRGHHPVKTLEQVAHLRQQPT